MALVPIIKVPNQILNTKCDKVGKVDNEVKETVQNLLDTLKAAKNPEGAGLSAPQIGVSKRILIARRFLPNPKNPDESILEEHVFIDPKIISKSKETYLDYEGCLSIPNIYGKVERAKKIKVKALNEKGEIIRLKASGFLGRIIQHEIDHLDGILFTSKITGKELTEEELNLEEQ